MNAPHDVPTAAELLESVREWLIADVLPTAEGRLKFHTRVAANVLAIVERELVLGAAHAEAHAARLARLGVSDDVELAAGIRTGRFDDRLPEVRRLVAESIVDKLEVANPTYLER